VGCPGVDDDNRRGGVAPLAHGLGLFKGSAQVNVAPVARLKAAAQDRLSEVARRAAPI
jgi:hypothetical protein